MAFEDEEDTYASSPFVEEFDYLAQTLASEAPDVETGLETLREGYSSYEFEDQEKANQILEQQSLNLRRRFGDTESFTVQDSLDFAPIPFEEIQGEGEDEEQQKIDQINKWEIQNIEALKASEDPVYIQNRDQLIRGVKEASTRQRRDVYGADNYVVTDFALRAAQGLTQGLSAIVGFIGSTGEDEVDTSTMLSRTLEENINPENDEKLWAAVASGVGSGIGAVGTGMLTGPAGAIAYLGASGFGSVVETVDESLDKGASGGEAALAGGIEAVSQAGQALVGGKIFGRVADKVLGKVTPKLGTRLSQKTAEVGKDALKEAGAEGAGQGLSNVAENVGAGKDWRDNLSRNVATSALVGGIVGGGFSGAGTAVNEYRFSEARRDAAARNAEDVVLNDPDNVQPPPITPVESDTEGATPPSNTPESVSSEAVQNKWPDLKKEIENAEGTPPLTETVRGEWNSIDTTDLEVTPTYTTEDPDISYVTIDDKLHVKVGEKVLQGYDHVVYVSPEEAQLLRDRTSEAAPDGTDINITFEDGKMFLQSDFIDDDLNISPQKTGKTRQEIKSEATPGPGSVPVFVSDTKTFEGKKKAPFFIGPAAIKEDASMGAAQYRPEVGTKERGYAKKFREKYGSDVADDLGMEANIQTAVKKPDGTFDIKEKTVGMWRYVPRGHASVTSEAGVRLEKDGIVNSMAYLQSKVEPGNVASDTDQKLIQLIQARVAQGLKAAVDSKDYQAVRKLTHLQSDVVHLNAALGTAPAQSVAARNERANPELAGEVEIAKIIGDLQLQADNEIRREFGKTLEEIESEAESAQAEVAAAEKDLNDPIDAELATLDAESEAIDSKRKAAQDETITKYEKEILELDDRAETTAQQRKTDIDKTKELLTQSITEKEAELKATTPKQKSKKASITKKLNSLKKDLEAVNEAAKVPDKKTSEIKNIRSLKAERKAAIRHLKKDQKTPKPPTPRQTQINKRKTEINKARAEGRAGDRTKIQRVKVAKTEAERQADRLARARGVLEKKIAEFSPEDQKKILEIQNAIDMLDNDLDRQKAINAKFDIMSKYAKTPEEVDYLYDYWRNNVLSGADTQIRNFMGNLYNTASTVTSFAVTGAAADIARIATFGKVQFNANSFDADIYVRGAAEGLIKSWPELKQIFMGEKRGRTSFNPHGKVDEKSRPFYLNRGSSRLARVFSHIWDTAVAPATAAGRLMAIADTASYRLSQEGTAHLAAYLQTKKRNVPPGERVRQMENMLYGTEEKQREFKDAQDRNEIILRNIGIKTSAEDRQKALFYRMEQNRSDRIRNTAARGGLKNIYANLEVNSLLSLTSHFLGKAAAHEYGGIKLPGRKGKFYPGKVIFPFLNTTARVGDALLEHTPIGLLKGTRGIDRLKTQAWKDGKVIDYSLEQREILGRAFMGSALMGTLVAIGLAYADEENPFIEFYGAVPRGKEREWQEKGLSPYTIRVGESSFGGIGSPLSMPIAIAASTVNVIKGGGNPATAIANASIASLIAVTDLTMIKSIGDTVDAIRGTNSPVSDKPISSRRSVTQSNWLSNVFSNTLTGFVPSAGAVRTVNKWLETGPSDTYNDFIAKMSSIIPASRSMGLNKPALNDFGEPINNPFWKRTALKDFFNVRTTDPVRKWMTETGHDITTQGPIVNMTEKDALHYGESQPPGYRDILTEEQSRRVLEISGPEIKSFLQKAMKDPRYAVKTEATQKAIDSNVASIRANAKYRVLMKKD